MAGHSSWQCAVACRAESWRVARHIYLEVPIKDRKFAGLAGQDIGPVCHESCQTCAAFSSESLPYSVAVSSLLCAQVVLKQCHKVVISVWAFQVSLEMKSHHLMRPPRSLSMPVTLSSRPRFFLSSSLISSSSRMRSSFVIGATRFTSSTP